MTAVPLLTVKELDRVVFWLSMGVGQPEWEFRPSIYLFDCHHRPRLFTAFLGAAELCVLFETG